MPARVLVLFSHPALQKSRVNRPLADAARGVAGVMFHDLYEEYPDFHIDVTREQELLLAHDVIVMQHPFYWYSGPALVKEWMDLVLEYGFAYGRHGDKLHGKSLALALSTGGAAHGYSPEGHNHYTIAQLLAPFEQTARLCGLTWLPPFVVHGTIRLTPEQIAQHATGYAAFLAALVAGPVQPPAPPAPAAPASAPSASPAR